MIQDVLTDVLDVATDFTTTGCPMVPLSWWFQHGSAQDIPSDVPEKLRARRVFQGAKAGQEA